MGACSWRATTVFGDGPDGAREATFSGRALYPEDKERWGWHGIIQAKFKQRLEGTKKDGKWVLEQLEEELKKLADPNRKLEKPKCYIFATNAVLTPTAKTGGKDKAKALVKKYSKSTGNVDAIFWDP